MLIRHLPRLVIHQSDSHSASLKMINFLRVNGHVDLMRNKRIDEMVICAFGVNNHCTKVKFYWIYSSTQAHTIFVVFPITPETTYNRRNQLLDNHGA